MNNRQAIIDTIGLKSAQLLFQTFGGELLYIPKSPKPSVRNANIKHDYDVLRARHSHSETLKQLAFKYNLSTRRIWTIIQSI